MKKPLVSVVIPAFNEEKVIGRTLEALGKQTFSDFEIIVVDNNSTDKTGVIVKSYTKKLPLTLLLEKKRARGIARAAGFEAAKGEFLFTTDADTVVPPHWIETFLEYFDSPSVIAVTSPATTDDLDTKWQKILYKFFAHPTVELYRLLFGHYWMNGYSFAIRKEAYKKTGGLNTTMNAFDDIEFGFRVKNHGKIRYDRKAPVGASARRYKEKGVLGVFTEYLVLFTKMKTRGVKSVQLDNVR